MSAESVRRTRERELERVLVGPLPARFDADVVGASFVEGYPGNLLRLEQELLVATMASLEVRVLLRHNPTNEHDPNAVEVHVPGLTQVGQASLVGHLTRPLAARIGPRAGEWAGRVASVRVADDAIDRPGLRITLWRRPAIQIHNHEGVLT